MILNDFILFPLADSAKHFQVLQSLFLPSHSLLLVDLPFQACLTIANGHLLW